MPIDIINPDNIEELLIKSWDYKFSNTEKQEWVLNTLIDFLKKGKEDLIKKTGFYPSYLSNILNISLSKSLECISIGYRAGLFELFYEIRCPDCNYLIIIISPDTYDRPDMICKGKCMKEKGYPVPKNITFDDYIPFFVLNIS